MSFLLSVLGDCGILPRATFSQYKIGKDRNNVNSEKAKAALNLRVSEALVILV